MSAFRPAARHLELGPAFYDEVAPARFPKHILRYRNQRWADRIGLGKLDEADWIAHFARFEPLAGSLRVPLALRYHGHQFQVYNPELGDGRGFLFAQCYDPVDGRLLDLATKGSGQTPWSRGADGRLTLKGGVREILATEMLEALGVDTSKSLSLVETGEELVRHDEPSPARASVLVRLSHSHLRIGSFQRLAALGDHANLRVLLDYCIRTYLPEAHDAPSFLAAVARRVARTGARWIAAGFVHGVLNTDNINITGESFDYGPWRFLPSYDPGFTAAYFDQSGLYAFGRQPDALAWNLTRLAECLLPLSDKEALERALNTFWPAFSEQVRAAVLDRLALKPLGEEKDSELVTSILSALYETGAPYEQAFFDWRGGSLSAERAAQSPSAEHYASAAFADFRRALEAYEPAATHNLGHRYFARESPRTMLIAEMEALWAPIAGHNDWSGFNAAIQEIAQMRDAYGSGEGQ